MVDSVFLNILEIVIFIILMFLGMKFSKYKIGYVNVGGYILIIISVIGLLVNLYNLIHNILI